MFTNWILSIAEKILRSRGGSEISNGVYVQLMSVAFRDWVYSRGYELWRRENTVESLPTTHNTQSTK